MKKVVLLSMFGVALSVTPCAAQTLNCDSPKGDVEQLICSDADLLQQHERIEAQYQAFLPKAQQPGVEVQIRFRWLKERDECRDLDCVKAAYERREKDLLTRTDGTAVMSDQPTPTEPPVSSNESPEAVDVPQVSPEIDREAAKTKRVKANPIVPDSAEPTTSATEVKLSPTLVPIFLATATFGVLVMINYFDIRRRVPRPTLQARAGSLNRIALLFNGAGLAVGLTVFAAMSQTGDMSAQTVALAMVLGLIGFLPAARHTANSTVGILYDAESDVVDLPRFVYFRQRCAASDVSAYDGWMDSKHETKWEGSRLKTTTDRTYHLFVSGTFGSRTFSFMSRAAFHRCASVLDSILAESAAKRDKSA